jgi:hypothetical protein
MTIDRALIEMMTDTVSWSTTTTLSQYGVPTYGTAHAMRARIVEKSGEVRDRTGQVREIRGVIWCVENSTQATGQTFTPTADDKVVLPDGTSPPIITVESYPDADGVTHHHKATFGY